MTALAMSGVGVLRRWASTSEGIDLTCNRLQMVRADASCYATQVVELQSFRHWADECLIRPFVSTDPRLAVEGRLEESVAGCRTSPKPTGVGLFDTAPEAFFGSKTPSFQNQRRAVSFGARVMHWAHAPRIANLVATVYRAAEVSILATHREDLLSGVTRPDVSASRPLSILLGQVSYG